MPKPTLQYAVLKIQKTVISLAQVHKTITRLPVAILPTVILHGSQQQEELYLYVCPTSTGYWCGISMLHDHRKTVRSSLIDPLRTAISTKSSCIRSLCNIFLSHLAAIFSIIFFLIKENTPSFSWSKNPVVYLEHAHCKEEKVTVADKALWRAQ